jgi:hypothetical protein
VTVHNATEFRAIAPELFARLAAADIVIAHNAGFDMRKLQGTATHFGLALPSFEYLCTLMLARRVWPQLGDLVGFVQSAREDPAIVLEGELKHFREPPFTGWGAQRSTFFGFVMMALASFYGHSDWGVMKKGGLREILDSFGWAPVHAVELPATRANQSGVVPGIWQKVQEASGSTGFGTSPK